MSEAPRLTRRDVLSGAAAVGLGGAIAPSAALAKGRASGRVFSVAVGRLVAGTSPAITAGRQFVLAGIQWTEPAAAQIELRARRSGGPWSPWAQASVRGHEPDRPGGAEAQFGEPVWFGPADEVQLRSAGAVAEVRVHFVGADPSGAPAGAEHRHITAAPYQLVDVNLPAGPGQPPIIARAAWAGRRHPPTSGPFYGTIDLAFVHHTENPNGYSPGAVPAMLAAIYDYHRFTRGYFDIAYNFIIDLYGRIWEARAGGVDEPVVGAHAGGYNAVSTGIAILGSFSFAEPSRAAMTALQRLLAWKLALHGVPVLGKVRVEVNPSDAFYTPFAPGQRVLLPRIAGHRDGDLTSCPGNELYRRLPAVRTTVNGQAGPLYALTLAASQTTIAPGTAVTVSGSYTKTLPPPAAPPAGAPVQIQSVSGDGRLTTLATVTAGADGAFTATLPFAESAVLRALRASRPASVSNLVAIGVTPVLTLTLASTAPVRVSGIVQPAKPVTVSVYKLVRGRRTLVSSRRLKAFGGAFNAPVSLGRKPHGTYVIVARVAADAVSLGAVAPAVRVTV
ncbi:MAG TPA: N-acetylmuramoyl-L-alanine amidase [Solirubrobacteraceae bacterium]|nr:N-acetylmuramoyl-L-alanine amidase [Solirubrobacteraceae bacterium]